MGRTILKVGVAVILIGLIWKLLKDEEHDEGIDRIE